jgi:CRISPR-associated protein Cmr1
MLKVPITLETITPLFTGNCNQEMTEIQSTSIMGSLRFWFEVICHFSGKFNNKHYSENKLNPEIFKKFIKNKPDATNEEIQKEFNLSPTAFYFGCTGWKSQIGIEKIDFHKDNFVNIERGKTRIIEGKNWHLPKQYYQDQFTIIFTLPDEPCKENILFPLLQFIQEYGFLGGKNNLGFGRVKIININDENYQNKKKTEEETDEFVFTILNENYTLHINRLENSDFHIEGYNYKSDFITKCNGITYLPIDSTSKNYSNNIKRLLKVKSILRNLFEDEEQKKYFGSSKADPVQATKIIPLIREKERGFLAIPGIITMEETSNDTE